MWAQRGTAIKTQRLPGLLGNHAGDARHAGKPRAPYRKSHKVAANVQSKLCFRVDGTPAKEIARHCTCTYGKRLFSDHSQLCCARCFLTTTTSQPPPPPVSHHLPTTDHPAVSRGAWTQEPCLLRSSRRSSTARRQRPPSVRTGELHPGHLLQVCGDSSSARYVFGNAREKPMPLCVDRLIEGAWLPLLSELTCGT